MTAVSKGVTTRPATSNDLRAAVMHSSALAVACYVSYWLITHGLSQLRSLSAADDQLGGMWAVIATVFVYRTSYQQDVAASPLYLGQSRLRSAVCSA
jgi:hypothetical protein